MNDDSGTSPNGCSRKVNPSEVARTFSVHPATLYRILAPDA